MSEATRGPDGRPRCRWCNAAPEFLHYHDAEWRFPVGDDHRLFEKLCLEGFQSGLSWRTILHQARKLLRGFSRLRFRSDCALHQTRRRTLARGQGHRSSPRRRGNGISAKHPASAPRYCVPCIASTHVAWRQGMTRHEIMISSALPDGAEDLDRTRLMLAGAPGFEPGNGGIKIRCLTTWLRPKARADHTGASGVGQRLGAGGQAHRRRSRRAARAGCGSPTSPTRTPSTTRAR